MAVSIQIVHADTPSEFWAREVPGPGMSAQTTRFQQLDARIQNYCQSEDHLNVQIRYPKKGQKVLVRKRTNHESENHWHRGDIKVVLCSRNGTQITCNLMDTGETITVRLNELREAPADFMIEPPQISKYALYGLQPLTMSLSYDDGAEMRPSSKWDTAAVEYFQFLIKDKPAQAVLHHETSDGVKHIILVVRDKADSINVNRTLVEKEFAVNVEASDLTNLQSPSTVSPTSSHAHRHYPGPALSDSEHPQYDAIQEAQSTSPSQADRSGNQLSPLNPSHSRTAQRREMDEGASSSVRTQNTAVPSRVSTVESDLHRLLGITPSCDRLRDHQNAAQNSRTPSSRVSPSGSNPDPFISPDSSSRSINQRASSLRDLLEGNTSPGESPAKMQMKRANMKSPSFGRGTSLTAKVSVGSNQSLRGSQSPGGNSYPSDAHQAIEQSPAHKSSQVSPQLGKSCCRGLNSSIPSPRVGKNLSCTPNFSCDSSPSPSLDRGLSPSPSFDRGLSPSLSLDRGLSPSPSLGRGLSPSPSLGRGSSPNPSFGRTSSPSPSFGRGSSPLAATHSPQGDSPSLNTSDVQGRFTPHGNQTSPGGTQSFKLNSLLSLSVRESHSEPNIVQADNSSGDNFSGKQHDYSSQGPRGIIKTSPGFSAQAKTKAKMVTWSDSESGGETPTRRLSQVERERNAVKTLDRTSSPSSRISDIHFVEDTTSSIPPFGSENLQSELKKGNDKSPPNRGNLPPKKNSLLALLDGTERDGKPSGQRVLNQKVTQDELKDMGGSVLFVKNDSPGKKLGHGESSPINANSYQRKDSHSREQSQEYSIFQEVSAFTNLKSLSTGHSLPKTSSGGAAEQKHSPEKSEPEKLHFDNKLSSHKSNNDTPGDVSLFVGSSGVLASGDHLRPKEDSVKGVLLSDDSKGLPASEISKWSLQSSSTTPPHSNPTQNLIKNNEKGISRLIKGHGDNVRSQFSAFSGQEEEIKFELAKMPVNSAIRCSPTGPKRGQLSETSSDDDLVQHVQTRTPFLLSAKKIQKSLSKVLGASSQNIRREIVSSDKRKILVHGNFPPNLMLSTDIQPFPEAMKRVTTAAMEGCFYSAAV